MWVDMKINNRNLYWWLSMCGILVIMLGSSETGLNGCGDPATDSVPDRQTVNNHFNIYCTPHTAKRVR